MNKPIIWIHGDSLNPNQPALSNYPESPAIFVWDEVLLHKRQVSLKRILFIYECLLELPVTIRRGNVAAEIADFALTHQTGRVITTRSISPGFTQIVSTLSQQGIMVEVLDEEPFVQLPQEPDLRRFSRYWRLAQKQFTPQ